MKVSSRSVRRRVTAPGPLAIKVYCCGMSYPTEYTLNKHPPRLTLPWRISRACANTSAAGAEDSWECSLDWMVNRKRTQQSMRLSRLRNDIIVASPNPISVASDVSTVVPAVRVPAPSPVLGISGSWGSSDLIDRAMLQQLGKADGYRVCRDRRRSKWTACELERQVRSRRSSRIPVEGWCNRETGSSGRPPTCGGHL